MSTHAPSAAPGFGCTHSYNKARDAFASKEEFDDYLETVEDISECVTADLAHHAAATPLSPSGCIPRHVHGPYFLPSSSLRACLLAVVYKLSFDKDVAEVEQQVADYQRQEVGPATAHPMARLQQQQQPLCYVLQVPTSALAVLAVQEALNGTTAAADAATYV